MKKGVVAILLSVVVLNASVALVGQFANTQNIAYAAPGDPEKAPAKPAAPKTEAEKKAEADKKDPVAQTSAEVDKTLRNSVAFMIAMQKVMNKLIWPVLVMIGGLLDNSILFGNGMEERLREIWVPIRNLVNILFVIALVGIALYNVLGIGDESGNYSIKSILPKIIVGIIVVNFSFVGIKVFLDSINVLTTSIFALPDQVNEGLSAILNPQTPEDKDRAERFCKASQGKSPGDKISSEALKAETETGIYRELSQKYGDSIFQKDPKNFIAIKSNDTRTVMQGKVYDKLTSEKKKEFDKEFGERKDKKICNGTVLSDEGIIFLRKYNSRNAALAMALNMSNILFYEDIALGTDTVEKFAINTIFSLMLYIVYVASFLALFVVLLARLVVMWVAIALSPVLLLGMAVPVIKEKISGFGDITSKFMQNALAPLGIAISMTIGWIMLKALNSVNSYESGSAIYLGAGSGIPIVGISTIQDLIVALGTVAVIWLAVFTAASQSIAAPVTDALKGAVQKAGKWIGTTPLRHAPLFPITIDGKSEDYTGKQVFTALREMGDTSQKDRALINRINGQDGTRGVNGMLASAPKTKDDFMKGVLEDRGRVTTLDKNTMENLGKVMSRNSAFRSIPNVGKNLEKAMNGVGKKKDSTEYKDGVNAAKEAIKAITGQYQVKDTPKGSAAATAAAAAATAAAAPTIAGDTQWGNGTLAQKFAGNEAQMTAAANSISQTLNGMANATTAQQAEDGLRALASIAGGPTGEQFKAASPAAFKKAEELLKEQGGVSGTMASIKNTAAAAPAATPPNNPTA